MWIAGRRDSTLFGVVDETTTTKFTGRACAVFRNSLPVVVDKVVVVFLSSLLFLFLTGSKLLPDFFLDVEGYDPQEMLESQKKMTQSTSQGSSGEGVAQIFDKIKSLGDEELVRSVNGVFEFHLDGKEPGVWFVDLKNNSGKDRLDATVLSSVLFESQRSKNSIKVLIKIKRRQR